MKSRINRKKKVVEQDAKDTLAGLGENVVRIVDADTGDGICYIGQKNEEHQIFFSRPIGLEEIEAISDFIKKKKFLRAMKKGKLEKAQKLADKKFAHQ